MGGITGSAACVEQLIVPETPLCIGVYPRSSAVSCIVLARGIRPIADPKCRQHCQLAARTLRFP
jgi:hypothetical protein